MPKKNYTTIEANFVEMLQYVEHTIMNANCENDNKNKPPMSLTDDAMLSANC